MKVANTTITDCVTGVTAYGTGTTMTVTGNTIVGPEAHPAVLSAGISFQAGSAGSASGNAISNDFTGGAGGGCGIRVAPAVNPTLNANTFPAPGNEQDVCLDDRGRWRVEASRCKGAEESDGTPSVLAFRVVPDLPDLLGTPAGDGDLASPRQRLLA